MTSRSLSGSNDCGAVDFIDLMRSRGVRTYIQDGRLLFQGPVGAVSPQELERARSMRSQIMDYLNSTGRELLPAKRATDDEIPMTYYQKVYSRTFKLDRRKGARGIVAAVRILGGLDTFALRRSIDVLIQRHEALRVKLVRSDATWKQFVRDKLEADFEILDLSSLFAGDREIRASRHLQQFVEHPIDLVIDSPLGARLVKMTPHEHILVLAIDHMVCDGYSMGIALRDVWSSYEHMIRGVPVALPRLNIQFPDYAFWLDKTAHLWESEHAGYWQKKLDGARRWSGSLKQHATQPTQWEALPLSIEGDVLFRLRDLARSKGTTLAMTVFAAYVAALSSWSNSADLLMQFVTNGRSHPAVKDAIGFFSSTLYLRIKLQSTDSFLDLLHGVTEEYYAAYDHDDGGRMAAQCQAFQPSQSPAFNWVLQDLEMKPLNLDDSDQALTFESVQLSASPVKELTEIEWDNDPALFLSEEAHIVSGHILCRSDQLDSKEILGFVESLKAVLRRSISDTESLCVPLIEWNIASIRDSSIYSISGTTARV